MKGNKSDRYVKKLAGDLVTMNEIAIARMQRDEAQRRRGTRGFLQVLLDFGEW